MGNILSKLLPLILPRPLLSFLTQTLAPIRALQTRIATGPPNPTTTTLPPPASSAPFWLVDPPFPELVATQSGELPREADVVVVGSGITAAAAAWRILNDSTTSTSSSTRKKVVVLEARDVCSGATGRNGGHIKAVAWEAFEEYVRILGSEEAAARAVRFQLRHVEVLVGLCRAEGWDVAECREVEGVVLYVHEPAFQKAVKAVEMVRKWVSEHEMVVHSAEQARERFNASKYVCGAVSFRAGALWPYRLVTSAWATLLRKYPNSITIESNTPATSITVTTTADADAETPYVVHTPRGTIAARHVLHATNAYAGNLLPTLKGCITAARGHMTSSPSQAGRPNPFAMAGADRPGERSWSVMYEGGFDYCSQRPLGTGAGGDTGGGEVLLGGGFFRSVGNGLDQVAQWDDSIEAMDPITMAHVRGIGKVVFDDWNVGQGQGREWCGIFAATGDRLPLVGRVDESLTGRRVKRANKLQQPQGGAVAVAPGEWISAGYCGEGMVMAWLSGAAVGAAIAGVDSDDVAEAPGWPRGKANEWFPDEMRITPARVRGRANLANLL